MRVRALVVACGILAVVMAAAVARAADEAETKAATAARSWLAMVDAAKYGPSWDAAAAMFRSGVTRASWERMAASARGQLGALKSRELAAAQAASSLPGAPDGHYVVLQFKASFAHKADATETVTMVLEGDGAWRTTGYFIR
jgi:Protein of unknown function (DUF4019)